MMRANKPFLVSGKISPRKTMSERLTFGTDEIIPHSGIYRVFHQKHRLPHEVTLLRDERFPKCAKCQDAVSFELVRAVTFTEESVELHPKIRLYEIPVLDEEMEQGIGV
jgi:hypothetical protein